ncbi:hypothetical protein JTB14_010807 [Gonioctena quinquepunctata]|nr:hypothetical protein JTB14_010807 [Gonioctena quinquepunctata]
MANESPKNNENDFWENGNFNGLADELAQQKVDRFNNGVILKNEEIRPKFSHELSKDFRENENFNGLADELAKQKVNHFNNEVILKNKDVKPEICEEKAIGKSEYGPKSNSVADMLSGMEIRPNFSHELSIDSETWPQQNIEEKETAMDNDTREEPTISRSSF